MVKLYALCLAIGQKCQFQRFKTKKYDNAEISLKLCTFPELCSQKLQINAQQLFETGPCKLASTCPLASKACKLESNKDTRLLTERHLFCYYGKEATVHVWTNWIPMRPLRQTSSTKRMATHRHARTIQMPKMRKSRSEKSKASKSQKSSCSMKMED
jgi:hypothetical protein